MQIGQFVFRGFAVTLDNKIGFFDIGNNQIIPAIYQNVEAALDDGAEAVIACSSTVESANINVVIVDVFSDGSLSMLTLSNEFLAKRTFNPAVLMSVQLEQLEQSCWSVNPEWVSLILHSESVSESTVQTQYMVA